MAPVVAGGDGHHDPATPGVHLLHHGDVLGPQHREVRPGHLGGRGEVHPDLEQLEGVGPVLVDEGGNDKHLAEENSHSDLAWAHDFTVAILLNDPQVVHCFQFTAKPNSDLGESAEGFTPEVKILTIEQPKAGVTYNLELELTDADSGDPLEEAKDLLVLAMALSGNWNQRVTATELGNGVYQLQMTFPNPGMYNLFFMAPSRSLSIDYLPPRTIQVTAN